MKFEIEIIKALQEISSPLFDGMCKFISHICNYIGLVFIFGLFLILCKKQFAIYFGLTYGFAILTNFTLKYVINRPRPYSVSNEIINILPATGASMPSGHTLSATIISCFCLFLIFKSTKNKLIKTISVLCFTGFISMVIVSRMYLGQHYLTDTLVGFIEGIVFSSLSLFMYAKSTKENVNGNNNIKR